MTPEEARAQLIKVQREIGLRGTFYDFVKMAWHLVEPGRPFKDNWHIRVLCDHLEKVFRGDIRRLVINVPPGCMKSLLVSVFWPAWCWIRDPSFRWIFASFDGSLTARDAKKTMTIVTSPWFRDRWGFLVDEDAAVSDHSTTGAGFRFSTSIKGKLTGRHCDCAVIDDPIKPLELSLAEIETVKEWWTGSLPSRFADLPTARIVIIMQRLHCDDLTGIVENEPGWTFLNLPMRYDPEAANDNDPRREEGELLWSERFPKDEVDRLEVVMGRRNFATQYQQRPTPDGGIIFDRAWFKHYEVSPARFDKIVQSWDCTFKDTKSSDFVCGQVWGRKGGEFYLLDQVHARMSFTTTCEEIKKMRRKWPRATTILIEDKANGSAVIDVLKKSIPGILAVNPNGGKEARANAVSSFFEAGNVYHPNPEKVSWVDKHRDELALFPASKNDDTVDACTQALTYLYARANRYREAMAKVQKMAAFARAAGRGVLRVFLAPATHGVAA